MGNDAGMAAGTPLTDLDIPGAGPETSTSLTIIEPATGLPVPPMVAGAGERASLRLIDFFTAHIRNPNTRAAYGVAVRGFFHLARNAGLGRARRNPHASCVDLYRDPHAQLQCGEPTRREVPVPTSPGAEPRAHEDLVAGYDDPDHHRDPSGASRSEFSTPAHRAVHAACPHRNLPCGNLPRAAAARDRDRPRPTSSRAHRSRLVPIIGIEL